MVHFLAYGAIILYYGDPHCVESVRIRSYSGPYFRVFSPNAGKYGPKIVKLLILVQLHSNPKR